MQAFGDDREAKNRTYRGVIRTTQEVYGVNTLCRPVRKQDLSMTLNGKDLAGETTVWSFGKSILYRLWYSQGYVTVLSSDGISRKQNRNQEHNVARVKKSAYGKHGLQEVR